jgi:hypothetical protein
LPETIYLNQYEDASWQTIADFDEDLDLTTAGDQSKISGQHLTVWREQLVSMKWGNKGTRGSLPWLGQHCLIPVDTARYLIELYRPLKISHMHPMADL